MRDTMRGLAVVVALGASLCAAWASWQQSRPEPPKDMATQQTMMGTQGMGDFKGFHNPIHYSEKLRLEDHLVKGKTTVIEFGAGYCGMCRGYAPRMKKLDEKRADVVCKTVEIDAQVVHGSDANSVAHRLGVMGIPSFRVYGPDRKLVSKGVEAQGQVDRMLLQAGI